MRKISCAGALVQDMADGESFIGYDEHGNPVERSDPPRVGPFIGYDKRQNPHRLANRLPVSHRPRLRTMFLALVAVGAVVGGWIALRDNGFVGGLDHDGPLELIGTGSGIGANCARTDYQVALDHLRNGSGRTIHIDRIGPAIPDGREYSVSHVYTYDGSQQGGGATGAGEYRLIDPRRPETTEIRARRDRGVSYFVLLRSAAYPKHPGETITIVIPGVVVDYHVGVRHFRETGGVEAKFECAYGARHTASRRA